MSMKELIASQNFFYGLIIGLAFFGLVVLLSASGPISYANYSDPLYFVRRQILLGLLPGAVAFFIFSRFDYRLLKKLAFPALLASLGLLLLVFIPGIGLTLGGSSSWVSIAGMSFQPSEFVKITFLVYAAAWLASRGKEGLRSPEGSGAFLMALAAVVLLLILQPDTGSMSVIAGTTVLMYLAAGGPVLWVLGIVMAGVAGLALLIQLTPYRAARFMTFLHPELDPQGVGYHINQAFLAIGSGGLFGLGFGQSRQKYLYLPEVQGDSIFAIMAEELGFLMVVLFICAVMLLVWHCFRVARQTRDAFGRFVAMGVGIWIAVQTIVNIGSMVGIMPMTGVTLPFVSYGNSSTLSLFVALGMVVSIARHSQARS